MAVANFTMGATRERPEYKVFLIESSEEAMHRRLQHLEDKTSLFKRIDCKNIMYMEYIM